MYNKKRNASLRSLESNIFKSLSILVAPTLIAKKRLLLFEAQIIHGGGHWCNLKCVKTGKEKPTHIIVEDSCVQNSANLNLALEGLNLENCVVICTRWLSDCIKYKSLQPTRDYEVNFDSGPATSTPRELGEINSPCKRMKMDDDNQLGASTSRTDKAILHQSSDIDVNKFACSQSSSTLTIPSGNERIIQELQKLADAFRNKGDTWRLHGYTKAISAIRRCGKEIRTYEDAMALNGVGHKLASKVWEIVETGSLRKVSELCHDHKIQVLEIFTKVWGVGPSTAEAWFQQGCRTLKDVEQKVVLTKQQKIGLKHYDDFQEKIPRHEVELIGQMVMDAACSMDPCLTTTLVGSYRRGKASSGDVDVLVCKPDILKSKDILSPLIASLKEKGLVTDDLVSLEVNGNQRKYLGVCRIPGEHQKFRRLDVFVVLQSELAPALMHYTGSALFNRSIRLLAAKRGMCLSEHALHAGVVREGMSVLNEGYTIPTPTEEAIFKALGMDFKPPEERDH